MLDGGTSYASYGARLLPGEHPLEMNDDEEDDDDEEYAKDSRKTRCAAVVSLMGLAAIAGQVLYYTDILGSGLPAAGSEIYCKHAVVGSGWSGVYYAWRLAEASEVPEVRAEDICIFEARDRIGGRAYSTGAPAWRDADLDLSLGAYRFNLPQQLVAGAVTDVFNFDLACHDGGVDAPCDPENLQGNYVIDNGLGYSGDFRLPLEAMLDRLRTAGMPEPFLNHRLVDVLPRSDNGDGEDPQPQPGEEGALRLRFENALAVRTDTVMLNLPRAALAALDTPQGLLFGQGTAAFRRAVDTVVERRMCKVYLFYEDAWWLRLLNKTGGWRGSSTELPEVDLRFGDGNVKCTLPDGRISPEPVTGPDADCRGTLRSYYDYSSDMFDWAQRELGAPQAGRREDVEVVLLRGQGRDEAIDAMHDRVVEVIAADLATAGVDPVSLPRPASALGALWSSEYIRDLPGTHFLGDGAGRQDDDALWLKRNAVIFPVVGKDIFVANEAFNSEAYAESSLILAERIMSHRFGVNKPAYVSQAYWDEQVLPSMPPPLECLQEDDCQDGNVCTANTCGGDGFCRLELPTGGECDDGDACTVNDRCDLGACIGEPKQCDVGQVCVGGECRPDSEPDLPACGPFEGEGGLDLRWEYVGTDRIRMAFSMPGESYVGILFGSSMFGTDLIMGWQEEDGRFTVEDDWSERLGRPTPDESLGGRDDLEDVWAAVEDGRTTVWFTRLLDTEDPYDFAIERGGEVDMSWAFLDGPRGELRTHGNNAWIGSVRLADCGANTTVHS